MSRQNDSDDESVDSNGLAEDDRNQVLGLDPGSLNTSTHDGGASGVDAQSGAHDTEGDGQTDAKGGPHVGGGLRQVPSYADTLTASSQ